jgi:hypothetical protein
MPSDGAGGPLDAGGAHDAMDKIDRFVDGMQRNPS